MGIILFIYIDDVQIKYRSTSSFLYNDQTGTTPVVIHGNGPIKVTNQSFLSLHHSIIYLMCLTHIELTSYKSLFESCLILDLYYSVSRVLNKEN